MSLLLVLDIEPELKKDLQKLQAEIPYPKQDKDRFDAWRKANGQEWIEKIRAAIGHDLQLSDTQWELLKKYLDANKLLV